MMINTLLALALLVSPGFAQVDTDAEVIPPDALVRAPVSQDAYSWDLREKGLRNGQLPASVMMSVGGCLLERDAAYTMSQMIEAAAEDGIRLTPEWCYRDLATQRRTYASNCPVIDVVEPVIDPSTGQPMVDENGQPMFQSVGTQRECSLPTATPSRSNHGWGRAVDFSVGRRAMGCGDAAFRWLQRNASDFGWTHPDWAWCNKVTREPWHWEYGGLQLLPFLSLQPIPVEPPANME